MKKKRPARGASKSISTSASTNNAAKSRLAIAQEPSAPFKLKPETVEDSLITGDNADFLKRYFGEREYHEMQELARAANARSVRGGPRVLILPGIMGSTLGSERAFFFDDVIWIDPIDIAGGQLASLSLLPGPARHKALGVIMLTYLKMKLSLRVAGYDADFHAYDWRQSIDQLGQELANRIQREKAANLSLVAHSMGGLVSRATLTHAAGQKVKRLVMLGTPNYGSFVPIQALRAIYPIIRKLALLDLKHSPEELAERVFNTFPGLYQMLPAPEKFSGFDVFDLKYWPKTGPLPRPGLLKAARSSQTFFAPPDQRFTLIAGINQDTVTHAGFDGTEFTFTISKEGDGTVPLSFAQLPNVTTYYIEASHGSLPNKDKVIDAVKDLLSLGETTALPRQWIPQRAAPRVVDEAAIRGLVPDSSRTPKGAAVSDEEVRQLIAEVAAPPSKEQELPVTAVPVLSVHNVVVGRLRQRRLDLQLALGSITEAISKAYVVGIFRDVTPSGAAQAIDQQMEGAVAEFSRRRMFSGNVGEVFVLPTGCHPLRPDHVVLAGLGTFDRFTEDVLELVAENVIRTLVRSGVDEFATVLVGGSSGKGIQTSLQHMLTGFVRGLLDADRRQSFRRVTLCEYDPERYRQMREELYRLAATKLFDEIEVSFGEEELPVPAPRVYAPRGLVSSEETPVYLLVRQQTSPKRMWEFETSVLTAGAKAAVVTGRKLVETAQLKSLLAQIEKPNFAGTIAQFGGQLADLVIDSPVLTVLATMKERHMVIVHDTLSSQIPWETIRIDQWVPVLDCGISRRYLAENLSIAKWLEERKQAPVIKILLVVDPTKDLPGARREGDRIRQLVSSQTGFEIVERQGSEATKQVLLKDFSSGEYDVVHYAGHAYFDPLTPSRSGIICAGKQVLSGAELASLAKLPNLVFFNACESVRVRKNDPLVKRGKVRQHLEQNVGLAEAFLRGGVANYVGTYWPVNDAAADAFAHEFYSLLLKGQPLGYSVLAARQKVKETGSIDWADYVLYGSPQFILKDPGSSSTPPP